ncbi:MAG: branched-chain amino acid ABC transporter permease [Deltaproteobacteria bacterium]|nr:branched-chain amino acid ABC transporter permease [Deltaproteobacteria bacterium]
MKQIFVIIVALLILVLSHYLLNAFINPYYLRIILLIGLNITFATSLNLINGYTGLFSLGHAGFMAVGAYTAAAFSVFVSPYLNLSFAFIPELVRPEIFFILSLFLGGMIAALIGFLIGLPTLRLRGDYLAIATLGFAEIIKVFFNNLEAVGKAKGFTGIPGVPHSANFFWIFLIAVICVWVVGKMTSSSKGKDFVAVREDEIASSSLGLSHFKVKMKAFVIGSFFAGLGGGVYAHLEGTIYPENFNILKSIEFVVMVVLGGMGRLWGVVFAAAFLTFLPEFLRELPPPLSILSQFRMILYSLIIIFTMLIRSKKTSWFVKARMAK